MTLAQALGRRARAGFVAFLTAGDPSLGATKRFLRALARDGADLIELGVPFSDPIGDGPTIQASSQRALARGTSLEKVLVLVRELRQEGFAAPIVLFSYLNPILALGPRRFASACANVGVSGVLVVDLPAEESGELGRELSRRGIEPVLLAAPTTSDRRLKIIGRASGSVVYYISREGVTGARQGLPAGLARRLAHVRRLTGKAVLVGFGVSTRAQARVLSRHADGVVVGSALVSAIAEGQAAGPAEKKLRKKAREIVSGLEDAC